MRLAAYDVEAGQLLLGEGGFVKECGPNEVGILLARSRARDGTATISLRGVFARDDSWLATADLFRRDADGDYWRLDNVRDLIHTSSGAVFTAPIRDALGDIPAVDLAVAYGLPRPRGGEIAVAAVTLQPGQPLDPSELTDALRPLPRSERPTLVRVVSEIPVTTWYRPITSRLRDEGIPEPSADLPILYRGPRADTYKPLTENERRRLTGVRTAAASRRSKASGS